MRQYQGSAQSCPSSLHYRIITFSYFVPLILAYGQGRGAACYMQLAIVYRSYIVIVDYIGSMDIKKIKPFKLFTVYIFQRAVKFLFSAIRKIKNHFPVAAFQIDYILYLHLVSIMPYLECELPLPKPCNF